MLVWGEGDDKYIDKKAMYNEIALGRFKTAKEKIKNPLSTANTTVAATVVGNATLELEESDIEFSDGGGDGESSHASEKVKRHSSMLEEEREDNEKEGEEAEESKPVKQKPKDSARVIFHRATTM